MDEFVELVELVEADIIDDILDIVVGGIVLGSKLFEWQELGSMSLWRLAA